MEKCRQRSKRSVIQQASKGGGRNLAEARSVLFCGRTRAATATDEGRKNKGTTICFFKFGLCFLSCRQHEAPLAKVNPPP